MNEHRKDGIVMELMDVMRARHSVRQYKDQAPGEDVRGALEALAAECSREGGLHIQIVWDDPECFGTFMAKYGKFSGVRNYIALVGQKSADLEERCGYYGERLVLKAQELGLNTCWVAMTYGKGKCKAQVAAGEKLVCVIALGYGAGPGSAHKSKTAAQVSDLTEDKPEWYKKGIEAALLAPTAVNQQKFRFTLEGDRARAAVDGAGFYTKVDLGIVKYHFEAVSGHKAE